MSFMSVILKGIPVFVQDKEAESDHRKNDTTHLSVVRTFGADGCLI